ncbi:MAG TPA: Gfo/Idh/MocA family oxidoreductase [Candidatus Obscuribacterales bacterium]
MTKSSNRTENDVVRIALVGYGLAGSVFHAPLIQYTEGLEIAAIVTRDPVRQAAAQADFPEALIVDDVTKIWSNAGEYDLAVIATPNSSHAPLAMAALDAGLNVVVDKPMATTVADCEQLVAASRTNKRLLSVFQNRRWDGDFLTVSLLVRSNNLGSINRFESRFERWRPVPKANAWRETGGHDQGAGLLYDLGSHLIDQAMTLLGEPISVYAEMNARRAGVETDDDCFVALTFADGVRAHLWASAMARNPGCRFRLCGMKGTFEKRGLDPQEDALRAGRRPNTANWGAEPSEFWGNIWSERDGLNHEGRVETLRGDYPAFYQQMRDAIVNGAPVPVDPADGIKTLRVIEAALRSAGEGIVVDLREEKPVAK